MGKKATTMTAAVWLDQVDAASVSEGEEVTLMDWGNCIVRSIAKDAAGKVTGLTGELHLAGSVKSTKLKLTWLPQIEDLTELTLIEYGHLITKKKLEEEDNFEDFVNGDSEFKTPAVGDANMRTIKHSDVIQIERKVRARGRNPTRTMEGSGALQCAPSGLSQPQCPPFALLCSPTQSSALHPAMAPGCRYGNNGAGNQRERRAKPRVSLRVLAWVARQLCWETTLF